MGRRQPASGEIHALVWQVGRLRSSQIGRMSVEIAGPITLRSPRSSKTTSSMNPQRAATVRALHSPIRTRLRRHKIDGKQICRRNQPVFDVRRIDCLARTRMSPIRSRCCRRTFFTQHVTVRTLHCRPPSVAVRSGGTCVVVEPGRMPATDSIRRHFHSTVVPRCTRVCTVTIHPSSTDMQGQFRQVSEHAGGQFPTQNAPEMP